MLKEKQIQRLIYGNYRNDVGETFVRKRKLHERKNFQLELKA